MKHIINYITMAIMAIILAAVTVAASPATDFSDSFDGDKLSEKWTVCYTPTVIDGATVDSYKVENGQLVASATNWNSVKKMKFYTGAPEMADYAIELSVAPSGTDPRSMGVLVRATDIGADRYQFKGYYVYLNIDKRVGTALNVQIEKTNGSAGEVGVSQNVGDLVFKKGQTYKLKVLAYGDAIRVYVDGQFVCEYKDSTYKNGYAGINTYMATFKADDFTLRALTDSEKAEFGPDNKGSSAIPAVSVPGDANTVAVILKQLGLFKGVSDTDFALEREPSRVEALVMLIRLLGKEAEALSGTYSHPFTDVAEWADKYVGYAYANGLTNGVSATEFGNSNASAATYLTFVLRALGYSDANGADFTWNDPFTLAKTTGILTDAVDTAKFLRGDVVMVSGNALLASLKGEKRQLSDKLISDGVFTATDYVKAFTENRGESEKPAAKKEYLPVSQYPEPMIISFESIERLESNSVLTAGQIEAGKCVFGDGALKLMYSEPTNALMGQYKVIFKLETKNFIDAVYTLAEISYKTTAKSGEIRLYNCASPDKYVVLEKNVAKSGGNWVNSELCELDSDMIAAFNIPAEMAVCLVTDDKNAEVELKELMLFCSPEQAKLATADVDPIIYKLGNNTLLNQTGVKLRGETDGTAISGFSKDGGEDALKLYYYEHNWGNYRVWFQPSSQTRADRFAESSTWYVRVRYKTNADGFSKLSFINNRNGNSLTLESDFTKDRNEWRVSPPVQLPKGFIDRLSSNLHVTLAFTFAEQDIDVYVSEIAFFDSLEDACAHYGDIDPEAVTVLSSQKTSMQMGDQSTVRILDSDENSEKSGNWYRNSDSGSITVKYTEFNKYGWGHYRFMAGFLSVPAGVHDARYVRIVYKAKNPAEQNTPVSLMLISNGKRSDLIIEDDVKDTNGEWVMSPVQQLSPAIFERLSTRIHCTVAFFADKPGGEYGVREIIFFNTLDEAVSCKLDSEYKTLNIAGTPIDNYTIVIPENAGRRTKSAAESIKNHIFLTAGVTLDIITDAEPERENEIVVGNTVRPASAPYYGRDGKYIKGELAREKYYICVSNGDLVITGGTEISLEEGMAELIASYLTYGVSNISAAIDIKEGFECLENSTLAVYTGKWEDPAPVANPDVFTDSFDDETVGSSPDYWLEAYATDSWHIKADGDNNKVYSADAENFTYTRLQVYERDIDYTVRMRFDKLNEASDAGVLARYNDVGAYIRVGYKSGEWYLRFSEGLDYNVYTLDSAASELKAGEWYNVRMTVNKNEVKVYVNDVLTLESGYITHVTPGPMGLFAENAAVSFDDVSVVLVSGQGKVLNGVVDSTFWNEDGEICSGSVLEMNDGTLRYINHSETKQFVSTDGGITWKNEKFTDVTTDCVNIFRLQSGNLIKLMVESVDGKQCHVSYTSADDGVTWTRGGVVSEHDYKGYGTVSQTIENDKFTQISNGRIFISQNYSGTIPKDKPHSGVQVFNEIWYSDDEGKTWTKSKTDSFDLTDAEYFAESKVIETADGALIWLTSWNDKGYIIAAESTDNGETFGNFYNLTDFTCSRSSFGIMRDVYADNNTTYYMTWVYNEPSHVVMPRTRLAMAMTTDGRNWKFLGDVYRWENNLTNGIGGGLINHIVDPFITVTEDYIFVGSGLSSRRSYGNNTYHNRQHQRIFRFEKSALAVYDEFPGY